MAEILSHPIPAVIILLGILIVVHEFGHFAIGRLCGVAVETFSVGFGPALIRWRRGLTEYRVSAIPLGGYVKFYGALPREQIPDGARGHEFFAASHLRRAAIIFAGPAANYVFAIFAFFVLALNGLEFAPPSIGEVLPGSAAEEAGLRDGDLVRAIDDKPIQHWDELESAIAQAPEKTLRLKIERGAKGDTVEVSLTPKAYRPPAASVSEYPVRGRAGIALASPGPVIAALGPDSLIGRHGPRAHGWLVRSVQFGDVEKPVRTYHDVEDALQAARASKAEFVTVVAAVPPERAGAQGMTAGSQAPESITGSTDPATTTAAPPKPMIPDTFVLATAPWAALGGRAATSAELAALLGFTHAQLVVAEVASPDIGLLPGDRIIAFAGAPTRNIYDLQDQLLKNASQAVEFTVHRGGKEELVKVSLEPIDVQAPEGAVRSYRLPARFLGTSVQPPAITETRSFGGALVYGVTEAWKQGCELALTFGRLFTGQMPLGALGGPILIAKVAGDSARAGWQSFLTVMALISLNLAIINLFPIPVLDGGQLGLVGLQVAARKPLSEKMIENYNKFGLVVILSLVLLAMYNDLGRFWGSMLRSVSSLF